MTTTIAKKTARSAEQQTAIEQLHVAFSVLDETFRWMAEAVADVGVAVDTLRKMLSFSGGPEMVSLHAIAEKLAVTCAKLRSQLPARRLVEVDGGRSIDVTAVLADVRRQRVCAG